MEMLYLLCVFEYHTIIRSTNAVAELLSLCLVYSYVYIYIYTHTTIARGQTLSVLEDYYVKIRIIH